MLPPDDRSPSAYGQAVPLRRRLASFAIALAINVLLLLMLIFMSPTLPGSKNGEGRLTTFNVNDSNEDKAANANKPKAAAASAKKAAATTASHAPKASVPPPIVPVQPKQPNMILMSHDDFAAADISKLPNHAGEQASAAGSAGSSGEGDSEIVGGGKGPHGEPLYAAEWYRRPTDAELDPFISKYRPAEGSWGEVACQTMPRFHVDNCVALQDSPPGSHLAYAVQQAAWQFLVKPPRVGGKSLVGAWVRIHISFSKSPINDIGN